MIDNNFSIFKVEIVEQSGIKVQKKFLKLLKKNFRNNPAKMGRQPLKEIVGVDRLANMTVTKTKGREIIPFNIYTNVKC